MGRHVAFLPTAFTRWASFPSTDAAMFCHANGVMHFYRTAPQRSRHACVAMAGVVLKVASEVF